MSDVPLVAGEPSSSWRRRETIQKKEIPEELVDLTHYGKLLGLFQKYGRSFAWMDMALVVLTVTPLRVAAWLQAGRWRLVVADLSWVSKAEFPHNMKVLATNVLVVLHGLALTAMICIAIHQLRFELPPKLRDLKELQCEFSRVCELLPLPLEGRNVRRPPGGKAPGFVFYGGFVLSCMHAVFSFGNAIHHTADSRHTVWDAARARLASPGGVLELVVIGQQLALGILMSSIASSSLLCVQWLVFTLKENLRTAQEYVEHLGGDGHRPLPCEALDTFALLVQEVQRMFDKAHEFSGFGILVAMFVAVPFLELSYWIVILAMLSNMGAKFALDTRGLAINAVEVCMGSVLAMLAAIYWLSSVTSVCDQLAERVGRLRLRPPSGKVLSGEVQKPQKQSNPRIISTIAAEKVNIILGYMHDLNSGNGMGFCLLGHRVSLGLFKTLILAYASIIAIVLPQAVHFFFD